VKQPILNAKLAALRSHSPKVDLGSTRYHYKNGLRLAIEVVDSGT